MMTSFGRLKVVEQLDDSLTQSYLMFDPQRDGEILLHILPEVNDENRTSLERLEKALIDAPEVVLERGDLLGVRYLISAKSGEFQSLIQQLEGCAREKGSLAETKEFRYSDVADVVVSRVVAPKEGPIPPTVSAAGEFTQLFAAPPAPGTLPRDTQTPSLTEAFRAEPVAVPESGRAQPGEFSRLFQLPPTPALQTPRVPAPDPPPNVTIENSASIPIPADPGGFTKEFPRSARVALDNERTMLFAAMPAPPASPARPQESPEFANFFESPIGPSAPDFDFDKHQPPVTPPSPRRAGDFTNMFGKPFSGDRHPQPMGDREPPADATGVFSQMPRGVQPTNRPLRGPGGDYTGTFDAPRYAPQAAVPVPAVAPAPPVTSGPAASTILIVAVLAILLILALALILYFALRS